MIFNIVSLKTFNVEAQFCERNEAKTYIDIHDPKREDLFILETKTSTDYFFWFYNIMFENMLFFSKLGGGYFC